jgi:hypothetical protein
MLFLQWQMHKESVSITQIKDINAVSVKIDNNLNMVIMSAKVILTKQRLVKTKKRFINFE